MNNDPCGVYDAARRIPNRLRGRSGHRIGNRSGARCLRPIRDGGAYAIDLFARFSNDDRRGQCRIQLCNAGRDRVHRRYGPPRVGRYCVHVRSALRAELGESPGIPEHQRERLLRRKRAEVALGAGALGEFRDGIRKHRFREQRERYGVPRMGT